MKSRVLLLCVFLLILPAALFGQALDLLTLGLRPGAGMPLGASTELYTFGGNIALYGDFTLPFAPLLFGRAGVGAVLTPTQAERSLTQVLLEGGVGLQLNPLQKLWAKLSATGGYYVGFFGDKVGGGFVAAGGLDLTYQLVPAFGIGIGASYQLFFDGPEVLYQGVCFSMATTFRFGAGGRQSRIEIPQIELGPIFPVFYKYYDDHPLGTIRIKNGESTKIEDVKVSLFVNKYMDRPKLSATLMELGKDEETTVSLKALFNDQILELTAATKVAAQIVVSYMKGDEEMQKEVAETIRIFNRNNMTWDDDQKAAAFVTNTDPTVLKFSKAIEGVVRSSRSTAINDSFRTALAVFESLRLYGMNYVIDPNTPYEELSKNALALDYLQFPRQTLEYKAGDCDDLAILYCALLESIGKRAAFITVPGHIYAAVSLGMGAEEAQKTFRSSEDIIVHEDEAWLPVEITMIDDGFIKAWQYGAREWRDHAEAARLYPISRAWETYEPVGIIGEEAGIGYPVDAEIATAFAGELARFVETDIAPMVDDLRRRIEAADYKSPAQNRLGVLYARYGLLDKAEAEFEKATDQGRYVPALLNLGNIHYMRGDMDGALQRYEEALKGAPNNPKILLSLAKVHHEKGNQSEVDRYFTRLSEESPQLAAEYAYLGGQSKDTARASQAQTREDVIWDAEE